MENFERKWLAEDVRYLRHGQLKKKFLFIAISGICFGIFQGSRGSHRAAPGPMCLLTITQVGCEHVIECINLVHADALRIAPQRQITDMDDDKGKNSMG